MPRKLKIGEKLTEGVAVVEKRFTNGHKSFTAAEARAITEGYKSEVQKKERFDAIHMEMYKDRDPIIDGEGAPRQLVMNNNNFANANLTMIEEQMHKGYPLGMSPMLRSPKEVTGKIGVPDYKAGQELPQHCPNLRISSLRTLQDNISGELEYLKMKEMEKRSKLSETMIRNRTLQRSPL